MHNTGSSFATPRKLGHILAKHRARNIGFVAQMHPQSQGYLSFIVPTLKIGLFHTLKFPASPCAALALVILRPVWRPYHAFNRFMNY